MRDRGVKVEGGERDKEWHPAHLFTKYKRLKICITESKGVPAY
jgi:hypothetical protein